MTSYLLAFDAIIDGADMNQLFDEGILVRPRYRPHFIHDLDLAILMSLVGIFLSQNWRLPLSNHL